MERYFCKGKKGFCKTIYDCAGCEFADLSGTLDGYVVDSALTALFGEDYDLDRLRELIQADRDGRCVVLPCKDGDMINVDGVKHKADHWNVYLTAFSEDEHRLALLNAKEAESALKGEQDE